MTRRDRRPSRPRPEPPGNRPRATPRARAALDAAAADARRGADPPTATSPARSSSSAAARSIPTTTPSTVYRTLDVLEDLGYVSHHHGIDGREEYHVLPTDAHGHLHCRRAAGRGRSTAAEADAIAGMLGRTGRSRSTARTSRSPGSAPVRRGARASRPPSTAAHPDERAMGPLGPSLVSLTVAEPPR